MRINIKIVLFILILPFNLLSQKLNFVTAKNGDFILNNKPFIFSGTNAYYCQSVVAQNDTNSVIEVFSSARALGMKVIRIWGFYDKNDSTDKSVIQYSPGKYNEYALKSLDFVLNKATEFNLKVIITLVNNWEDYGGMNQYVNWLSSELPVMSKIQGQKIVYRNIADSKNSPCYRYFVNGYKHDDFYTHPRIIEWFKNYVKMILTRTNTYNNIQYKNDTTIFALELANEAESSDNTGMIINGWIHDMASFIKSIDSNHLVGTGESGFDIKSNMYSDIKFQYNSQEWIFNGYKGISYSMNLQDNNIDFGSSHLYKEDWNFTIESGKTWIEDHKNLSDRFNKPYILAEYGARTDKINTYNEWLKTAQNKNISGVLLWQLVYNSKPYDDGYFVQYPKDIEICNIIFNYSSNINNRKITKTDGKIYISQNYPNPCSSYTVFEYNIPTRSNVTISVYNILGQKVLKYEDQNLPEGIHTRGINTSNLATGIYYLQINYENNSVMKKILVIK